MYDITIIGAGVVGALIARELSFYQLKVALIDKDSDVGNATTMANSAIVHSGYDPEPNSLKAKLNVEGNAMFDQLSTELDVNFGRIGSLTLAMEDEQWLVIRQLVDRAKENKVPVTLLSGDEVRQMEPNVNPTVKGGLLAPTAGIVNPFQLCVHAVENAVDNGVNLFLNSEVIGIKKTNEGFSVDFKNGSQINTKYIVNAAGIYSDKIAMMIGDNSFKINPRKGEYYVLDHFGFGFVNHVIFPLPTDKGKGILITPTTSGNYLVGPSSEFVDTRSSLATDMATLKAVRASATQLIPSIPFNQVIRTFSGLRATPSTHDFIISESAVDRHFINVAGIESPGLASSPAIAKYVVDEIIGKQIPLVKNELAGRSIKPYIHPLNMDFESRKKLISEHPEFGDIICNCEKISRGEILQTLNRSCPPHSIKAIKKRTRAGFGRCQGGFCQTRVISILADFYKIDPTDVDYDEQGTPVLIEDSKENGK
ncbi:MAG TPA: NAD(P)/FAD-dependent oxidoreductase [Bacilli bacterium]|nr:NAD(P)/FAD-dependent oxidoreductase [Bacilli bacterium]